MTTNNQPDDVYSIFMLMIVDLSNSYKGGSEGFDFAPYIDQINALIDKKVIEARIDENQRRLDGIIQWEKRTPVPGEITTASFGSAGASLEASGFKHSFENRIKELQNNQPKKGEV